MLIYNSQKEFIGIDTEDLKAIGFANLADLQIEATDFSDLFLRTPGYIHNFKYVHWIDYIAFGGSTDIPKAIIHTQKANYSCTLSVKKFFVTDSPASDAYAVHLHNIRMLSPQESAAIAEDLSKKAIPDSLNEEMIPEPYHVDKEKILDSIEKQNAFFAGENVDTTTYEEKKSMQEELVPVVDEPQNDMQDNSLKEEIEALDIDETPSLTPQESTVGVKEAVVASAAAATAFAATDSALDLLKEPEQEEIQEEIQKLQDYQPQKVEEKLEITPQEEERPQDEKIDLLIEEDEETTPQQVDNIQEKQEQEEESEEYVSDYVYDPQVASDELGLPIDLIEEFIEDFIAQAKEFKDGLYKAIEEEDMNNLRILSHKLKGVAANLRIEDALDVLVKVNTSDDLKVVKTNLNYFYTIIKKLDAKEKNLHEDPEITPNDDEFVINLKEETQSVVKEPSPYKKEEVAKDIGLDMDTFNDLFDDYMSDAEEIVFEMHKLIESDDLIHLKKHITKLEGMNKNMRITHFSDELKTLLDTASQDVAREALAKIKTKISSMKD